MTWLGRADYGPDIMPYRKLQTVLLILALAGCAASQPSRDLVGYVPPTNLPAQSRQTMVLDDVDNVWSQLAGHLGRAGFEIDHHDLEKKLIIARYSGNPEPFIDCGSIVIHENGALGQVAAAVEAVSLHQDIDDQPAILNRILSLESRSIIRLAEESRGTMVSTDTTYVVTKIVDIETAAGGIAEGSRETVSFSAGERGEFSKGTACQPNGVLDSAIVQDLANIVASNEIARRDLTVGATAEPAATGG